MDDLNELLKTNRIFSSLDEKARSDLLAKTTFTELPQHKKLFEQGEPSDSVYILLSGKLAAEFTLRTGETKIVNYIDVGETVGEVGALSNEPRSLTVKALKDSALLKLSSKEFIDICHQYPAVMYATFHPVVAKSTSLIEILSAEKTNKHILIVPAHHNVSLQKFSEKLIALAENFKSLLVISDYQEDFDKKYSDVSALKEKIQQLLKNTHIHKILYILKSHDSLLAKLSFKKMDMIYLAAHPDSTPKIDHHILDKIHSQHLHLQNEPAFIFLHKEHTPTPKNISPWLKLTNFSMYHHVRMNVTSDFQRLLRFIRGKAVGLVLSGGGTRGWAHLGAIKALTEIKIPIDIIGGTSVGALAASCYALNESYQETYEKFHRIVTASNNSVSWRNLTWPTISLFNAKHFTGVLQEVFQQIQIEELWLPFFCVSCNLTNNMEAIHTTGTLWETTRASASLPGLIPPMLINGDIHLDGGLLNNLPIDVMRKFVGKKGKVIAIDLNNFAPDQRSYYFPPVLTFKEMVFSRFGRSQTNYKFPRFMDIFLRGLLVGSLSKTNQNSLTTNIFVSLNLNKFRLLHSNPKQAARLMEIGYKETLLHCMNQL